VPVFDSVEEALACPQVAATECAENRSPAQSQRPWSA
jgi:hypothetical protein